MTTMISELYDALISAGAEEEKARKAAETVAAYENRFASIETKLVEIQGSLRLLQWMLALLVGGVGSLIIKAFA
jgi:hypothetical protein